MFVDNIILN